MNWAQENQTKLIGVSSHIVKSIWLDTRQTHLKLTGKNGNWLHTFQRIDCPLENAESWSLPSVGGHGHCLNMPGYLTAWNQVLFQEVNHLSDPIEICQQMINFIQSEI